MHCPQCDAKLNACTPTTPGERPRVGDLSLCIECGHILAFESLAPLTYRLATPEEATQFCSLAGGLKAQVVHREYHAWKRSRRQYDC